MKIKINEEYRLWSDPLQIKLQRRTEPEKYDPTKEEQYWNSIGYYKDVPTALEAYAKYATNVAPDIESFSDLKQVWEKVNSEITKIKSELENA
ncbi:hypothetical protein EP56_08495 [Listeriaceae bacterium FSL A5-0209]|uniref:Uncharacterized protein n=1 Tax=Listeria newyorkensis TaxID=1497681 RepID=A0A841Z129_9LIST|nr:hypothetical protein [Listeria newyorkensis]KGL43019.1 hypothetical protein EP56_08495 [Listeriaceae bacterium FSL A5-0209]MBC1459370.1 hypothetical protein [Listeria newyorkensis]